MDHKILIYAPNISRENFIALTYLGLGEHNDTIRMEVLKKSTAFRAAQVAAILNSPCSGSVQKFLMQLFQVAKGLGGTRFIFKSEEASIAETDANVSDDAAAELFEQMPIGQVFRIEIY